MKINTNTKLRDVGALCRKLRIEHGYLLKDVAFDTKYSIKNISTFERGGNDSLSIFLWYANKFFYIPGLEGVFNNGKIV